MRLIVFILTASVSYSTYAQYDAALLTEKFNSYYSVWPKAKLHLIFNQPKYSPGDTAFFKAYFLRDDWTSVTGKQLIEVDLVNHKGQSLLHNTFSILNGITYNQLVIPDTIPSGIYKLAGRSRLTGTEVLFIKEISIVKSKSLTINIQKSLEAFVEGNHLINDIPNRVVIRSSLPNSPVSIIDEEGAVLGRAITNKNGIDTITFIPKRKNYFLKLDGYPISFPFPVGEEDGCSLFLSPPSDGKNKIDIYINSPSGSSYRNRELFVIFSSAGKVQQVLAAKQGNQGVLKFEVAKEKLPAGVNQVSVLTKRGELLASRNFYLEERSIAKANFQIAQTEFAVRDRVKLEILVSDENENPIEGEFSMSVLNSTLFEQKHQNNLLDELTCSNFKQKPSVNRSDSLWMENLDLFLITANEQLPWKDILAKENVRSRANSGVLAKSGKIYFADTNKPLKDDTQLIFYFQHSKVYLKATVENGKFRILIPDIFGKDELFYVAETFYFIKGVGHGQEILNSVIEWDDTSIPLPSSTQAIEKKEQDSYGVFIAKDRLMDKSYGFFSSDHSIRSETLSNKDFEDRMVRADLTINVQDYFSFLKMEELIKEVIPSLWHRKIDKKDVVRVNLPDFMAEQASGDPVYIIDGIATKNTSFFLSLLPVDLLTIKIVRETKKLIPFGMLGKNGFVLVQTKKGNVREPVKDSSFLFEGLTKPINFINPNHSDTTGRKPNFKSTIYWNPFIRTDKNGKATIEFYCSDDVGFLNIQVNGMAGSKPFTAEKSIMVGLGTQKK